MFETSTAGLKKNKKKSTRYRLCLNSLAIFFSLLTLFKNPPNYSHEKHFKQQVEARIDRATVSIQAVQPLDKRFLPPQTPKNLSKIRIWMFNALITYFWDSALQDLQERQECSFSVIFRSQYSVIYRRVLLQRIPNTNLIVTDSILNQIKSLQNKISQICFLKPKCPMENYYKLLSRHSFLNK